MSMGVHAAESSTKAKFPSVGDDIKVKWMVDGRTVLWPATVTSIEYHNPCDRKCRGELSYDKLGQYTPIETPVVFTISDSQ